MEREVGKGSDVRALARRVANATGLGKSPLKSKLYEKGEGFGAISPGLGARFDLKQRGEVTDPLVIMKNDERR